TFLDDDGLGLFGSIAAYIDGKHMRAFACKKDSRRLAITPTRTGAAGPHDERDLVAQPSHDHACLRGEPRGSGIGTAVMPIVRPSTAASRLSERANWLMRLPLTLSAIAARLSAAIRRLSGPKTGTPIAFMPGTIFPSTNEKPRWRVSATFESMSLRECPA